MTNLGYGFILNIIMLGQNHSGAIDEFDGGFKQHCLKFFLTDPYVKPLHLLTKQHSRDGIARHDYHKIKICKQNYHDDW